jgi:cell division transport system permease protein
VNEPTGPAPFGPAARPRARFAPVGAFAHLLRRTGRLAVDRPRAALWAIVALTTTLVLVGVVGVAADNLDAWTRAPGGRASVVVYLANTVDAAHGTALADELARQRWVARAEYVPAAETARRLEVALGYDASASHAAGNAARQPQLLDGVDLAGLPATIELMLAPGVRDVVAMSPTTRALRDTPGVDDIVIEDGGEDRVAAATTAVRLCAWSGAALLVALALLAAVASVRVHLDRDPRELAVARLFGAGPGYAGVPCVLAGVSFGAVAAGLAVAIVYALVAAYGGAVAAAVAPTLGAVEVALPSGCDALVLVAIGAAVGAIGGGLAGVSRATR